VTPQQQPRQRFHGPIQDPAHVSPNRFHPTTRSLGRKPGALMGKRLTRRCIPIITHGAPERPSNDRRQPCGGGATGAPRGRTWDRGR
jgi:hypothetical protein